MGILLISYSFRSQIKNIFLAPLCLLMCLSIFFFYISFIRHFLVPLRLTHLLSLLDFPFLLIFRSLWGRDETEKFNCKKRKEKNGEGYERWKKGQGWIEEDNGRCREGRQPEEEDEKEIRERSKRMERRF